MKGTSRSSTPLWRKSRTPCATSRTCSSNAALEEQAIITRNSLKEINERLRSVELEQARSKGNSKWTDRILWAITSAALGLLLGMASGKLAI